MHNNLCVIGDPVSHSRSPLIHRYWLKRYQIDADYSAVQVSPERLEHFLRGLQSQGLQGCNITLPHKEKALAFMDELSEEARSIGAVNTVLRRDNGKLFGHNTDAEGFISNLRQAQPELESFFEKVVIIGAGGAARALIVALQQAGCQHIVLTNRTTHKAEQLAAAMRLPGKAEIGVMLWEEKEALLKDTSLLINASSLGMEGQPPLELPLTALAKSALVTDIVYRPLMTPLLLEAARRGNPVVTGIGMLLYQAAASFALWFGIEPEVTDELHAMVLAA